MEIECAVAKDCRELKYKFKGQRLQHEIAKLVAEKYLHLYVPGKLKQENESNKYWLRKWADLLIDYPELQGRTLNQLRKFTQEEQVDWDE